MEKSDILGKTDDNLFDEETATLFIENDWEVIQSGIARTKEETAILPSGKKSYSYLLNDLYLIKVEISLA